jgi:hypothetical protein
MKFKLLLLTLFISVAAMAQKETDTVTRRPDVISRTSHAAIVGSNTQLRAALLTEGFEGLDLGDINGQNGWFAQYGNWEVDDSAPVTGTQNMYSISDGLGQTFAVTSTITPGSTGVSTASATLSLNNNAGVSWEFIPQASGEGLVVTRIVFGGDGNIYALVDTNGGEYVETGAVAPSGYFQVSVSMNEASGIFTLFINGANVFSAPGFGTQIDNIAFLSGMEIQGPVFLADDLVITDELPRSVPTLGEWGLFAFLSGLTVLGVFYVRKTRVIA